MADRRHGDVLAHRHRQHQPLGLPILGDQRHADISRLGVARAGDALRLAVDRDRAAAAAQDSEQRQQQLALALPVEAAKADDLAAIHRKRYVMQPVVPAQLVDLQHARPRSRHRLRREDVFVLAADHQLDHLIVGLAALGEGLDVAAVPENRAIVGQFGNLVHAVGDVEDRQPLLPQHLQCLIDLGNVGGRQRRGRLVEDQHPRLAAERLGDLHHLAPRERQVLHQLVGMHIRAAGTLQQFFGAAALRAVIDQSELPRRIGDADIVRHRQVGHQRQFLEHADDAGLRRLGGRLEARRLAQELHLAVVRLHDAGDDLDQRRFAGAVLAQDRVDAPGGTFEIHVVERPHAADSAC